MRGLRPRSFNPPSPFDGKRPRVGMRFLRERQERGERALVFEALKRVGHRPPAHTRLAGRIEDRSRQLIVGLQSDERLDR